MQGTLCQPNCVACTRPERGILVLPVAGGLGELTFGRHRQGSLMLRAGNSKVPHNFGCPLEAREEMGKGGRNGNMSWLWLQE